MTCREAMERQFDFCLGHERLLDAVEVMSATGDDRVPVVTEKTTMQFEGIITARAALVRLGLADRRPSEVMCREVAAPALAPLRPEQDLSEAGAAFRQHAVSWLPVVAEGRLVGVLRASRLAPAASGVK